MMPVCRAASRKRSCSSTLLPISPVAHHPLKAARRGRRGDRGDSANIDELGRHLVHDAVGRLEDLADVLALALWHDVAGLREAGDLRAAAEEALHQDGGVGGEVRPMYSWMLSRWQRAVSPNDSRPLSKPRDYLLVRNDSARGHVRQSAIHALLNVDLVEQVVPGRIVRQLLHNTMCYLFDVSRLSHGPVPNRRRLKYAPASVRKPTGGLPNCAVAALAGHCAS